MHHNKTKTAAITKQNQKAHPCRAVELLEHGEDQQLEVSNNLNPVP
jgi:hypothetical protein